MKLFCSPDIKEVRWVRHHTWLTIRVKIWERGFLVTTFQRFWQVQCTTQQGLSPVNERTGQWQACMVCVFLHDRHSSCTVFFFQWSPCSFVYDSPNPVWGPLDSVHIGITWVRFEPGPRTHLTSLFEVEQSSSPWGIPCENCTEKLLAVFELVI